MRIAPQVERLGTASKPPTKRGRCAGHGATGQIIKVHARVGAAAAVLWAPAAVVAGAPPIVVIAARRGDEGADHQDRQAYGMSMLHLSSQQPAALAPVH
jgi:hypothetical protein